MHNWTSPVQGRNERESTFKRCGLIIKEMNEFRKDLLTSHKGHKENKKAQSPNKRFHDLILLRESCVENNKLSFEKEIPQHTQYPGWECWLGGCGKGIVVVVVMMMMIGYLY